jgi:uncharacterized SAM-dependent methyltransferase
MSLAVKIPPSETEAERVTRDIERWLERDPTVNLASDMYIGDVDDRRWKHGHSSPFYYVKGDERATFKLMMNDLNVQADNLFEMGIGGEEAVRANTLAMARKIGVKHVFAFDLSRDLAEQGVEIVETELSGVSAAAVIDDMYEKLRIVKAGTLVAALGQEIGNLETYEHPHEIETRLTEIFSNYASAVTSRNGNKKPSYLLISYDANRDTEQTKACYFNPEFGGLVRSVIDRQLGDTSFFDYDVVVRPTAEMDFLATGLRANRDHAVPFNGKIHQINQGDFYPVLNSSRFSVPFMTRAAEKAGWEPMGIWSATGRVHYQLFRIGPVPKLTAAGLGD